MSGELQHPLLAPLRELHRALRASVVAAFERQTLEELAGVAKDAAGDTIYNVDEVSESLLLRELARSAEKLGGLVLVAEGLEGGCLTLPEAWEDSRCKYRLLVDPIDGTRGLMYQKRPAWILTGVARNRGPETRLSDIELALQTEIPLNKQNLTDELWAVRGKGARAERVDRLSGERRSLRLAPSRATSIEHGFAMISRFFPGVRDELAAIDDEIVRELIGDPKPGKALCFEDQYLSTGGQLYELMAGHDRFVADLRPLLAPLLRARGLPRALACHPYDLCSLLIAQEMGVVVRHPLGAALDAVFDVDADVAWAGYANEALARSIEPVLVAALERRGYGRAPA